MKNNFLKSVLNKTIVPAIFLSAGLIVIANVHASEALVKTYADIAHATYEDALMQAKQLEKNIEMFLAEPSERNLQMAKQSWLNARVPYQQSEVYRFGNAIVDDWEGKVNAWPLDEGLIDYVDLSYGKDSEENAFYTANVIANPSLRISGQMIDASEINKELLREVLHEGDQVEANVSMGYHAIEFLLWGQDLNGTNPGSGNRPATDFDMSNCSHGNCDRRAQYLRVTAEILVEDLEEMVGYWAMDGEARESLMADPDAGIASIITGIGSLSYGELAGERTKLGLMLHDPEEEHDCFSDNTHNSHYYDVVGILNVYNGTYNRIDGSVVSGDSLAALLEMKDSQLAGTMQMNLQNTFAAASVLKRTAESGKSYDQMLAEGDPHGNRILQDLVDALTDQTRTLQRVVAVLGIKSIEFEGSDSLDNPSAVQ